MGEAGGATRGGGECMARGIEGHEVAHGLVRGCNVSLRCKKRGKG